MGRKTTMETDYIKYKAKILKELGLKNEVAVESYLRNRTAQCTSKEQREIKCDIIARTMLSDFYNGDMTFVRKEVM